LLPKGCDQFVGYQRIAVAKPFRPLDHLGDLPTR
jgi:hypothetical protein